MAVLTQKDFDMKRLASMMLLRPFLMAVCASGSKDVEKSVQPTLAPGEVPKVKAQILSMRDKTLYELLPTSPRPVMTEEGGRLRGVRLVADQRGPLRRRAQHRHVGRQRDAVDRLHAGDERSTGPGIGYKELRQVLILKNKEVFDQFRKLGADVAASANATMKLRSEAAAADLSTSFNPFISTSQFTDQGLLLQADWGGAAFVPYAQLNQP